MTKKEIRPKFGVIDEVPIIPTHAMLEDRDLPSQHPIEAVDGLREELDQTVKRVILGEDELELHQNTVTIPIITEFDGITTGSISNGGDITMQAGTAQASLHDGNDGKYATAPTFAPTTGGEYAVVDGNVVITEGRLGVDPLVVHTFGSETIAGDKTLTGTWHFDWPPWTGRARLTDMAGSSADWRRLYSRDITGDQIWRRLYIEVEDSPHPYDMNFYPIGYRVNGTAITGTLGKMYAGDAYSIALALKLKHKSTGDADPAVYTLEVWIAVKASYSTSLFCYIIRTADKWDAYDSSTAGTLPTVAVGEADEGDYLDVEVLTAHAPTEVSP